MHSVQLILLSTHYFFFFFNDTATTEIYTLSLHDALPIYAGLFEVIERDAVACNRLAWIIGGQPLPVVELSTIRYDTVLDLMGRLHRAALRSEEHTSELQSQSNLVCRLLLEKKK